MMIEVTEILSDGKEQPVILNDRQIVFMHPYNNGTLINLGNAECVVKEDYKFIKYKYFGTAPTFADSYPHEVVPA